MKPLPKFMLHRPNSLEEALDLMAELDLPKPIAGGTDLIPLLHEAESGPENLVDLNGIEQLSYIKEEDGRVSIGAATTHSQLLSSEIIASNSPALHDAISILGSVQIRNRGTLGGNLCNASPAADTAPPLLVHGAEVTAASKEGSRTMPLTELFAGPKINSLETSELLTGVRFPVPPEVSGSAFHRLGRRRGVTLSVVNAAAYVEREGDACRKVGIALGSVAPTPILIPEVEEMMEGQTVSSPMMEEIGATCKDLVSPVDDVRGSAEYRCEMAGALAKRAFRDAWARAGGASI